MIAIAPSSAAAAAEGVFSLMSAALKSAQQERSHGHIGFHGNQSCIRRFKFGQDFRKTLLDSGEGEPGFY